MNYLISKLVKPFVLPVVFLIGFGQAAFAQQGGNVNLSLAYSQSLIEVGETVTLTYTINGPNGTSAIGFTDTFPAGLTASSASATQDPTSFCGFGSRSANATATELVVTGVALNFGLDCRYTLDFVGASAGSQTGVVSGTTSSLGELLVTGASTEVDTPFAAAGEISLGKEFTNDPVIAGAATILEFTLLNSNTSEAATDFAFTDDLNAMLAGANFDGTTVSDTCGGTMSGGATASYVGGTVPARSNCKVSISVEIPANAPPGLHENVTAIPTATVGGVGVVGTAATDRVKVLSGDRPLTLSHSISGDATPNGVLTFSYTLTNPNDVTVTSVRFSELYTADIPGLTFQSATGSCGASQKGKN